ncbi:MULTISPECIES: DNA polymerase III subunit beta [unclassified Streptomyces]|uniref:DNA polymerase III subunit beta n=1 Tax=unclassified Streptomyces TaxID=2593676 RepID=UPI0022575603|nr:MULTISPECIES: DNA polymerase III subunit beta [unclassified Streptomyces]WSP55996.1 DNA polymerase III subunit beta [Streptomyces sp. NBC_01241]WSU23306.1 DNA polymerase III subunit beta [Streptomyces sp. NBC_01108]MCX4787722.1 DNA polymerase III subunit beta [Streptomyces sp. NBC_01221]MCX4796533.1 DNA polymerase III subunit beta [Streptomyces sp. NBC_01242]WSJ37777.1 DNA polymerase III subunit beta [Streptomyces sp. NBC_01321]
MEFRMERSALTDAVAWAARVLPTRSPVPVLGGLLLEAADGRLRISGLDYEASACIEVEAETVRAGKVLVMGRRLLDVCRVLPEGAVECEVEGSRFSLAGDSARFGLSVLPFDDYPALPPLPEVLGAVDAEEFAVAVAHVAVAAGRDDTLPTLTGIRLALDGDTMTLAATDRYRFAVRTLAWKPGQDGVSADVVISARRLTEIARSFSRAGMVQLALDGGSVGFELAGMRTTVRLLDGRLPRHDKLFAMTDPARAVLDRAPLVEAVKRVAVVAEGGSPLHLTFSGDSVLLQAGYEDDVASQRLPAALGDTDELTVAFNPSYLMDALASFDAPVVRFELLGPGQRAMVTGWASRADAADEAARPVHQHLLMSARPLV